MLIKVLRSFEKDVSQYRIYPSFCNFFKNIQDVKEYFIVSFL